MTRFFRRGIGDVCGDELVTHDQVMNWLPRDVQRELRMALPPEQRGWWTHDEAAADGGYFVEITDMTDAEPRYIRGGR